MIKVRDLVLAEEALEAAEQELRKLSRDPREWSAYETMDKRGMRTLVVPEADFQRRAAAMGRIESARQQLVAAKRLFLAGVLDDAAM